jgi:hypothetical protein
MPMYRNFRNRQITVFLNNSVPVKFQPGEHKVVKQEGLEKLYASYLQLIPEATVKEAKENLERKEKEKGLINEVKQPDPNKELTKEPVEEATKSKRKVIHEKSPKLNEGYSPFRTETKVASTNKQGNE